MNRAAMMSFLDLVSCAFGTSLLVFLMASTASLPQKPSESNKLVIVQAVPLPGGTGEIGIQFLRPGRILWDRVAPKEKQASFLSAAANQDSGGDAILVLFAPEAGIWRFRPYVIHRTRMGPFTEGVKVTMEVRGEGIQLLKTTPPESMLFEGETGQVIQVLVK